MANEPTNYAGFPDKNSGTQSKDERIRQLENDNRLLKGKIRGFVTLGDMYKDSKKRISLYEKQTSLLVQLLSLLIPATITENNESANLPDELETIMENRPSEESLMLLTSITSKLRTTAPAKSETQAKATTKDAQSEIETTGDPPPDYQQVSASETETTGSPSSASFSLISPSTVLSNAEQYQDEFAELKTKLANPFLAPSKHVQSVFEVFELVLHCRQPHQNGPFNELPQRFSEVLQNIEKLEEENKILNVRKQEENQPTEQTITMGTVQGQHVDNSWVDVSHDATEALKYEEMEKFKSENEHQARVIAKLRVHISELTKANVAWDKKYDSMKKEFSTKILKLKNAQKLSSKRTEAYDKFVLVGPEEADERRKNAELEAKLLNKEKEQESELNLLRQQVRIFKDDFATERNEHKKLWQKHKRLNENYQEAKKKILDTSSKLAKTQKQLATEKREKELLQASVLRSQEQPQSPLLNLYDDHNELWKCKFCTFDNISERVACEMCGRKNPSRLSEPLAPLMSRVAGTRAPPLLNS